MTQPNVGGRPLKFATPEELASVIDKHLKDTPQEELTLTGLCLAIGTSRGVLDEYKKREGYEDIVTRAKLYVEHAYEVSLRKNSRSGDIFGLKNFGWKDKQELEHTGADGGPIVMWGCPKPE